MKIEISDGKICHEYHEVPDKVAKAIITLLDECENDEPEIISSKSEVVDKEK